MAHSIAVVELCSRQVSERQVAGRMDAGNEETETAGQLRHSRAVRAGWEDPLLAIKRRSYVDGRHFGCEKEINEAGIGLTDRTT